MNNPGSRGHNYDSKTGPNTSDEIRRGYVPQYHVPGVVIESTGEKFGDQLPVLRDGKCCN